MPSTVRLDFFGQVFNLKADDADVDLREMVDYVHGKVQEQAAKNSALPSQKQVVLAVLNMARDYILVKKRLKYIEDVIEKKSIILAAKIDSALAKNSSS